ncbi:MAG TPA: 30S ribosomal protein S20 [Candidatus Limnocylindrales bacterium]|nr:30S ribosomal protein S20 [Candidatus Limnocylindrales bacterium]
MARTPRKWQGARNPSGLKRVRQAERRHAILQPRRSAAKTLVTKAIRVATAPDDGQDAGVALAQAIASLDRAAKVGAIHPNAAARRKSRLAKKVNALAGGTVVVTSAHVAKTTGKAAAAKAAKARIAAGRAEKAKGAQTAAGKARAALSRTTRTESAAKASADTTGTATPAKASRPATKASAPATKSAATKSAATRSTSPKAAASSKSTRASAEKKPTTRAKKTDTK